MDKFKTVLDGKVITQVANAVGGYNYVSYVSGKSFNGDYTYLIRRVDVAGTDYKYFLGSSVKKSYADAWTGKADLIYSHMYLIKTGQ